VSGSRTARVVCIGIATLDAIVVVDRLPDSDERIPATNGILAGGGVAATAAVALARLGVPVAFVGRVGDDASGRLIRDGLGDVGVDVRGLRLDPTVRSPVSAILVEAATGARSIAPYLGDPRPIELDRAELTACADADWIHLDDLGLATLPSLEAAGVATPVSVDDGVGTSAIPFRRVALYAPTAAVLERRFPAATLEASATACVDEGPRLVVATRGADGALVTARSGAGAVRHASVPGWPAEVVSTLGAGDVFHGALLAGLAEGRDPVDAARRAAAVSAIACGALDGRSAIPTRAALEAWMTGREAAHD
jgi:sugar/nucleoside kinase (ribokinase family)